MTSLKMCGDSGLGRICLADGAGVREPSVTVAKVFAWLVYSTEMGSLGSLGSLGFGGSVEFSFGGLCSIKWRFQRSKTYMPGAQGKSS